MQTSMPTQRRSPRLFLISAVLVLSAFWGLSTWLATLGGFDADPGEAERAAFRQKLLLGLRDEDRSKLESFAWVDRSRGSVQIPIELAMKLIVPELSANKPKPA